MSKEFCYAKECFQFFSSIFIHSIFIPPRFGASFSEFSICNKNLLHRTGSATLAENNPTISDSFLHLLFIKHPITAFRW